MFAENTSTQKLSLFSDDQRIKVVCRIRPTDTRDISTTEGARKILYLNNKTSVSIDSLNNKSDHKQFSFDYIANEEVPQEEIFRVVGLPYAQACLDGYNGTILCYGQTGSGKTYTMFGPPSDDPTDKNYINVKRGLVPRVLEYLWNRISRKDKRTENGASVSYVCRCSFFEIYQDKVYDLLDANGLVGKIILKFKYI